MAKEKTISKEEVKKTAKKKTISRKEVRLRATRHATNIMTKKMGEDETIVVSIYADSIKEIQKDMKRLSSKLAKMECDEIVVTLTLSSLTEENRIKIKKELGWFLPPFIHLD